MILAQTWSMSISAAVLLAAMATLGYVLGRRRPTPQNSKWPESRHEITRALGVAQELEAIAYRLRKSMAFHVPAIVKFNTKLHRWEKNSDVSWHELCERADEVLKPALRLSNEISHAYADLLQQMTHLSTFAELRTDPLTGIANRRTFDESLEKLLAQHQHADEAPLAVAMLDLDHFKQINDVQGHLAGDRVLQDLTQLLRAAVREGDVVARFGGEEFVVLMPRTPLSTACGVSERIRQRVEEKLATTVSIGLAASEATEAAATLVSRADMALYTAKKEGRNCIGVHEGGLDVIATVHTAPVRPADQPFSTAVVANTLPDTIPFAQREVC